MSTSDSHHEVNPIGTAWSRSVEDADFRQRLIDEPRETLATEVGMVFPDNVRVKIIQNTPEEVHIVVPCEPSDMDDSLDEVVGFGLMHHIPEHNAVADIKMRPNVGRPAPKPGFGKNPFGGIDAKPLSGD